MSDQVADLLNTCDVKISANSRSFNVDVHVYEHANKEKIDVVINNAIYAMTETQGRIKKELLGAARIMTTAKERRQDRVMTDIMHGSGGT